MNNEMSDLSIDQLLTMAADAYKNGQYAKAESTQTEAVNWLRTSRGDALRISDAVEMLGAIHYVQEKFALAENEYREAVGLRESVFSAGDQSVLRCLLWLAKSEFKQQKYEASERDMRRLLSAAEAGAPSDVIASINHELGFQLYFVGKYTEADPYLTRALEIYETTKGASDLATIDVLERIALNAAHCPELNKDPEPFYRAAVDRIPAGQMQQTYAEHLCRLAEHYRDGNKFQEADKYFEELLKVLESLPPNPELHWVESNCVEYFKLRSKPEVANRIAELAKEHDLIKQMLRKELSHAEQKLGEDDPKLIEALLANGNDALFNNRLPEAEQFFRRAVTSAARILGEESEEFVTAMNRLSVALRCLEQLDEANILVDKALQIANSRYPATDLNAWTTENAAVLREVQGDLSDASKLYERSVALRVKIHGFPSEPGIEAKYRLSGYYLRTGNMPAAKAVTAEVVAAMDSVSELSGYEKYDYLHNLAAVLDWEGNKTEAEELRSRAEKLLAQAKAEMEAE